MTSPLGQSTWLFHAGALGDHVMIWPLVRALARQGTDVTVVASASHARLCVGEVGRSLGANRSGCIRGFDAEQPRFTRLWRGASGVEPADSVPGVNSVIAFTSAPDNPGAARWHEGAAAMFPGAAITFVDRPDRESGARDRSSLWARAGVALHGTVQPRPNPRDRIVLYPGAGNDDKRLAMAQWAGVARALLAEDALKGTHLVVLLGRNEIERGERFDGLLRAVEHRGRLERIECSDVLELAEQLRQARVFIGADTGPAHLAAQLGIPTLAIFGPTDPRIWAPVGPLVRVLHAPEPGGIGSIEPGAILDQTLSLLLAAEGAAGAVPSG